MQGRFVGLSLDTGDRIDECHLISGPRRGTGVWVYENGRDVFIPTRAIKDCWEVVRRSAA
jgi:hypothetical protein